MGESMEFVGIKLEINQLTGILLIGSILFVGLGFTFATHPRADIVVLVGMLGFVLASGAIVTIAVQKEGQPEPEKPNWKTPQGRIALVAIILLMYLAFSAILYAAITEIGKYLPEFLFFLQWGAFIIYLVVAGIIVLKKIYQEARKSLR